MQGVKKIKKQLQGELDLLKDRDNTLEAGEANCERALEVLREPETILRKIFESSPDLLSVLDKDLHIIHSNWHGGYEYVPEEIRKRNPLCYDAHYPGQNRPCASCHVLEVFNSGKPVISEKFNPRIGQLEAHAYPIFDDSGKVALVVEHVSNITKRKKMEEELRKARDELEKRVVERTQELNYNKLELEKQNVELRKTQKDLEISRNRYVDLYDFAPLGYVTLTAKGTIHEANLTIARMLGVDLSDLIGRPFRHYVMNRDAQKICGHLNLLKLSDEPATTELSIRLKNSGFLEVQLYSVPVKDFGCQGTLYRTAITDITEVKGAEDALRKSEERYALAMQGANDGIWDMDLASDEVYFSPRWKSMLGYEDCEIANAVEEWKNRIHPDDYRMVMETRKAYLDGHIPTYEVQSRLRHRDGCYRWILARGACLRDSQGIPYRFSGSHTDITDKKRAEDSLRESEKHFRQLVEHSPVAMAVFCGIEGRVPLVNRKFTELFGYTIEDVPDVGRWWSIAYPDDKYREEVKTKWIVKVEQAIANQRQFEPLEARVTCKDGSVRHVEFSVSSVGERNLVTFIDLTESKKAEEAIRQSEKKFRTIFEESKDIVFVVDTHGRLLDINPASTEILGYTKEELLAMNPARDLYVSSAAKAQLRKLLVNTGFVNDYELELKKKDGRKAMVHITASVTRDDKGRICGYRGIAHDVTERKKLEQQLLQGQKLQSIGLLAGGVAQDFNNLLTAISGYGQIIQDCIPENDELLHESIEQVLKAAQRAAELTRNLLAFSRKQVINPKPAPIDGIIHNANKFIDRIIGEDIKLSTCFSDKQLLAMVDAGQIEQVLMNLATNAREAMPGGGILRISSQKAIIRKGSEALYDLPSSGKYAMISISDTGSGIDEKAVERIFEPFYTTKEIGKGTGLGLSISYGIIKQHNGSILVKSEPGKGTTFTIYLPLAEERPESRSKRKAVFPGRNE
jgi:PAS domain S-box-containing protein